MITGLFKLIFNLIRLAFLLLILGLIFHTWTIKQAMKFSLSWSLGADVSIEAVKMDWKNTGFEVHGLEIANPYKFPAGILADVPLAIISIDVPELLHGGIHLKTVGFNLKELWVVHDPELGLNVMALKPLKKEGAQDGKSRSSETAKRKIGQRIPKVVIDELIISIGDITFVESLGAMQKGKKIRLGIQGATYHDLEGTSDITRLIVTLALQKLGYKIVSDSMQRFLGEYVNQKSKPVNFLDRLKKAMTS